MTNQQMSTCDRQGVHTTVRCCALQHLPIPHVQFVHWACSAARPLQATGSPATTPCRGVRRRGRRGGCCACGGSSRSKGVFRRLLPRQLDELHRAPAAGPLPRCSQLTPPTSPPASPRLPKGGQRQPPHIGGQVAGVVGPGAPDVARAAGRGHDSVQLVSRSAVGGESRKLTSLLPRSQAGLGRCLQAAGGALKAGEAAPPAPPEAHLLTSQVTCHMRTWRTAPAHTRPGQPPK